MIKKEDVFVIEFGTGDVGISLSAKGGKVTLLITDYVENEGIIGGIPSGVDIGDTKAKITFSNIESLEVVANALSKTLNDWKKFNCQNCNDAC